MPIGIVEGIGLVSTIYGGLQSIFGEDDDPYEEARAAQRKLLSRNRTSGTRISNKFSRTTAVNRRRIEDSAAAANAPESVAAQRVADSDARANEMLLDALFADEQAQAGRELGILSAVPPEPEDTSAGDLLGLGLQLLGLGGDATPEAGSSYTAPVNNLQQIKAPSPVNRITPQNPSSINSPGGALKLMKPGAGKPGFKPSINTVAPKIPNTFARQLPKSITTPQNFNFGKVGSSYTKNKKDPFKVNNQVNGFRGRFSY